MSCEFTHAGVLHVSMLVWNGLLWFSIIVMYDVDCTCENVAGLSEVYLNKLLRWGTCKAVIGLATFSTRVVAYLILIRRAGTFIRLI